MSSKHLCVASELGLFEQLAAGPAALDTLAERARVPRRSLRIVADAMVALGMLEREGERYRNSAVAQAFLSGRGLGDLRAFLRFWNRIAYVRWEKLEDSVRAGHGAFAGRDFTPEEQKLFSEGVESVTLASALALAATYDFARHRKVLDLGGGTGSFLVVLAERFPELAGTLVEVAGPAAIARRRFAARGLEARLHITEGNFFEDPLPEGHDAVLMSNIVHIFSPERNRELLRRVRERVPKGARALLVDFWMDRTKTQPLFGALIAGEFLVNTADGDVYSLEEMREWLGETGWRFLEHKPLSGPASLVVAEAA
jgi:SAM-dependent methyltransferase